MSTPLDEAALFAHREQLPHCTEAGFCFLYSFTQSHDEQPPHDHARSFDHHLPISLQQRDILPNTEV